MEDESHLEPEQRPEIKVKLHRKRRANRFRIVDVTPKYIRLGKHFEPVSSAARVVNDFNVRLRAALVERIAEDRVARMMFTGRTAQTTNKHSCVYTNAQNHQEGASCCEDEKKELATLRVEVVNLTQEIESLVRENQRLKQENCELKTALAEQNKVLTVSGTSAKWCDSCGQWLTLEKFTRYTKDKKEYYRRVCLECHSKHTSSLRNKDK